MFEKLDRKLSGKANLLVSLRFWNIEPQLVTVFLNVEICCFSGNLYGWAVQRDGDNFRYTVTREDLYILE